jgi:hypothetical protein
MKVLTGEDIRAGIKVGDPKIGAEVRDYLKK